MKENKEKKEKSRICLMEMLVASIKHAHAANESDEQELRKIASRHGLDKTDADRDIKMALNLKEAVTKILSEEADGCIDGLKEETAETGVKKTSRSTNKKKAA